MIIGIDEAGRGPVLGKALLCTRYTSNYALMRMVGPMVYGIAYCPLEDKKKLKSLGFAGSSGQSSAFLMTCQIRKH